MVRAEPFLGPFPELGPPVFPSNQLDQRFRTAFEECKLVMAGGRGALRPTCCWEEARGSKNRSSFVCLRPGYVHPVSQLVPELLEGLDSPALALLQWQEELAVVR